MTHVLVEENVDVFVFPRLVDVYKEARDAQITIGDLHGNAMKLIFMLVKHGLATNITPQDYETLVTIYQTEPLSKEDLEKFNQIVSKMEFRTDCFIRLLGDDLADRGKNDYFTLKIIEQLSKQKVPFEIINSNHGFEVIKASETGRDFDSPSINPEQAVSMLRLQSLIDINLVDREEILTILRNHYPRKRS